MPKASWPIVAVAAVLTIETSSEACRVSMGPEQRLARGYAKGAISAVALVEVSRANYTSPPNGDAHPWQASATVKRVLRGPYAPQRVRFTRGWGSAACDDGHPAPKVGEQWVIYFWKRAKNDQPVWQSYPANVAYAADPLLRRKVR